MSSAPSPRRKLNRSAERRVVRVRTQGGARYSQPIADQPLLMVEPAADHAPLAPWLRASRDEVKGLLVKHGAVLLRGFSVPSPEAFRDCAAAVSEDLLDYLERAAAREVVVDNVFTSTAYAADQPIPIHHEMSYSHNWPERLYFYCERPASQGGETPLAWESAVYPAIPEAIRRTFEDRKIMYIRNFGRDVDLRWEDAFQTDDRNEVEAYCDKAGITWHWLDGGGLRTEQVRQAVAHHPVTGQTVWFNHAALFHPSNMPSDLREALTRARGAEGLPRTALFGDGTPIPDEVVETIRETYWRQSQKFRWQAQDVLLVDNFLCAHGRRPFEGERRILVAMSDLFVSGEPGA